MSMGMREDSIKLIATQNSIEAVSRRKKELIEETSIMEVELREKREELECMDFLEEKLENDKIEIMKSYPGEGDEVSRNWNFIKCRDCEKFFPKNAYLECKTQYDWSMPCWRCPNCILKKLCKGEGNV